MTTGRKNAARRLIEWWLQSERLRELKALRLGAAQHDRLDEAKSALIVAWRVLAGLEPVAAKTRAGVALPLLAAGLSTTLKVVAPERGSFAELFDEPDWQARFTFAGLTSERQAAIRQWLSEPSALSAPNTVAESALITLRTALESTRAPERAVRRIRLRRIALFVVFALGLALLGTSVALLLSPAGPPDIAAGKSWTASSGYPGFSSAGSKPARPIEGLFFNTNEEDRPWWSLDLAHTYRITSVEVVNRSDCCRDRAYPLALELSDDGTTWKEVARIAEPFSTWEPKLAPTKARYVRLKALKRTLLHFRDVKVHGTR